MDGSVDWEIIVSDGFGFSGEVFSSVCEHVTRCLVMAGVIYTCEA